MANFAFCVIGICGVFFLRGESTPTQTQTHIVHKYEILAVSQSTECLELCCPA